MSRRRRTVDMTGIEIRHQRHCTAAAGSDCACTPSYRVTFWDQRLEKPLRATLPTAERAAMWRRERSDELDAGILVQPSALLVTEALDEFIKRADKGIQLNKRGLRYKPSALRSYREAADAHLVPHIGRERVSNLTDELIQEEVVERLLGLGRSPSTIRNAIVPLRVVCNICVRKRILRANPCTGLELPALNKQRWEGIDPADMNAMVEVADERDQALVATALYAGLRRGELQALLVEHVDLRRDVIRVRHSWDRKAGRVLPKSRSSIRDVMITGRLRPLLEARISSQKLRRGDLVFGRLPDRPFNPRSVAIRLRARWDEHDLPVLTFHECRHAFASSAIAAKANIKTLQQVMGHSSMAVTYDVYGHLLPNGLDQLGAELDAHFS